MNANELADALDDDWADKFRFDAAIMLRQQQAEIEALKKSCLDEIFKRTYANQSAKVMEGYCQEAQAEIEALKLHLHTTLTNRDLRTYDGKTEMNNKPVAWMSNGKEFYVQKNYCPDFIPLYTHPVKELTDEEIDMLAHEYNCIDDYPHEFVRACIRKAQENEQTD